MEELLNKEESQYFFLFFFFMPDSSGDRPTGLAGAPAGLQGLEHPRCMIGYWVFAEVF